MKNFNLKRKGLAIVISAKNFIKGWGSPRFRQNGTLKSVGLHVVQPYKKEDISTWNGYLRHQGKQFISFF